MKELKAGDIFLTRGTGLISKLIRIFSTTGGEDRTQVNHVGIMINGTEAVEALATVQRHSLFEQYGGTSHEVAIFRPINLTDEEIGLIVERAKNYVGKRYGYIKIAAHFGDWLLGGRYFFRRIASMDDYPICSWLVASSFAAAGKNFGCEVGQAEPDDIWDFVTTNKDKYEEIRSLGKL